MRQEDGTILLHDVAKNRTSLLIRGEDVKDDNGDQLLWNTFRVSPDMQFILFGTDYTKQWRHSSHQNFWLHSLRNQTTTRILPASSPPHTATALFSPVGHGFHFVHANDLYVVPSVDSTPIRVTADGGPTSFNGVPDWVYEEEVFGADSAAWWSPDAGMLAFLSLDEELVPEFSFPVYNPSPSEPGAEPYPTEVVMRYPKPGYPNPLVKVKVFDLSAFQSTSERPTLVSGNSSKVEPAVQALTYELEFASPFPADDVVIGEVSWVSERELLVKATNRIASIQRMAYFDLSGLEAGQGAVIGKVVREDDMEQRDGGWVEAGQSIVGLQSSVLLHSQKATDVAAAPVPSYPAGYLDVVPDAAGFNHIALFSPPDSAEPVFLTSGEWEVDGAIQAVDVQRGLVYFIAANPSIERHLYSVPLPSSVALAELRSSGKVEPATPLTDAAGHGFHSVSFSPFGGFYLLSYHGPSVPWQKLISVDDKDRVETLTDNARLAAADALFEKGTKSWTSIPTAAGNESMNAMELRPKDMDLSGKTKYPVLFQVYGGPASQMVTTRFVRDWHHFLCTALGYVIVNVDGRGTGFKGRGYRMPVRDQLGLLESADVIAAAEYYSSLDWVDSKRVGVWGWSYGGYLTSKVVERNSSAITLGMAVAPVIDWRYYDSVYTERYMSTPQRNPSGYLQSAVTDMTGFAHADFFLAHGTGDDNVHFANSVALLDRLQVAGNQNVRFRLAPDSDHSMGTRGAYWELMRALTAFLEEKWGEGGRTKLRWKLKKPHVDR